MPATIARWTGTQISLSAMTRATPTGSCSGVTGCTRFPTPPRTAPTIAEPPPILNTHCCSLMAVPGPVPPDSPLRSCHGPGAGGSCARGVLLAGGEQLVQQWLHLGHRQGEGTEPAGQRAADVPAWRRDHVAVAAVPDDRVGDASPTGDGAGGQPRRDGVEVPAAAARPGHRPGRCCQRLEPAERGLAGGGVQVEHVEHHPGGEPDVGLRVAPPPGPDLGAVGGRVGEHTRRQGVLAGLRAAWLPARAPQGAPPLPPPAAGDGGVVQRNHGNGLLGVRQGAVEQGGVTPPMTHRNPPSKRHVPSRCGTTSKWRGRAGPPSPRALARPCPATPPPAGHRRGRGVAGQGRASARGEGGPALPRHFDVVPHRDGTCRFDGGLRWVIGGVTPPCSTAPWRTPSRPFPWLRCTTPPSPAAGGGSGGAPWGARAGSQAARSPASTP